MNNVTITVEQAEILKTILMESYRVEKAMLTSEENRTNYQNKIMTLVGRIVEVTE